MGYLKGKSALMIFDRHANLKYKFGNRQFWAEGYYVSTVGLNEATIAKYIREQEARDIAPGQAEREGVRGPVRAGSDCRPVSTGSMGQTAIGPERSEGRRL